jgi:hypothetical protein
MSNGIEDTPTPVQVRVDGVLEKFDGNSTDPADLTERIYIEDSEIVKVEKYENGEVVSTEIVKEVTT